MRVSADLVDLLDGDLGNVDEEELVGAVGGDADELVRVGARPPVVVGLAQAEEGGAVRQAVARHVGRRHHVVAVAEERAQDAAEHHLQFADRVQSRSLNNILEMILHIF